MSKQIFSAIRCKRIKNIAGLRYAEAHGKREDEASKNRVDPVRTKDNLAASKYCPDRPLDLVDAFKARKAETGANERAGSAIGLHVIAIVSPEALDDKRDGGRHNPNNIINKAVFTEAQKWAEKEFGEGSLIAARMDMDEKGAGVVDLFIVPVSEQKQRQGSRQKAVGAQQRSQMVISTRSALEAIQRRSERSKSYETLQDSWANHLNDCPIKFLKIQRGRPKAETQRKHVHSDVLREEADKLTKAAAKILNDHSKKLEEHYEKALEKAADGLDADMRKIAQSAFRERSPRERIRDNLPKPPSDDRER